MELDELLKLLEALRGQHGGEIKVFNGELSPVTEVEMCKTIAPSEYHIFGERYIEIN